MTVVCTRCGALSVHQCQCVYPITYTGSATPNAPTRDLVSLPKDSQEIISEKLSQSATKQAPGPTTKESSAVEPTEIAKRAALTALSPLFEDCHDAMRDAMAERDYDYLYDFWTNIEGTFRRYREMYDYAKSIGALSE